MIVYLTKQTDRSTEVKPMHYYMRRILDSIKNYPCPSSYNISKDLVQSNSSNLVSNFR